MWKSIILFIVCINFVRFTNAQWQPQNFLPQGNHLTSVFFTSSEKGWAAGEMGTILKTTDGGNTWDIVYAGSQRKINALYFLSDQIGFAVGDSCLILATENGGQDWEDRSFGDSRDYFMSIYFSSENIGWIGGNLWVGGSIILKTTDTGKTWEQHDIGVSCAPYSIHFSSETHGWMAGTAGTGNIVRTTDGGKTWQAKFLDNRMYYSIWGLSESTAIAALNFSEILRTTNGGDTWTKKTIKHRDNDIHFTSLFFTTESTGWLVGGYSGESGFTGVILKTVNAGEDWQVIKDDIRWGPGSVYFSDENTGWVVGNFGLILQTTDAGATWHEQSDVLNSFLETFHEIDFVSRTTGWAASYDGLIHTTNGGFIWQRQDYGSSDRIMTMDFISENIGWIGCENGDILKTQNGGQSWKKQYSCTGENNYLNSMHFHSENIGWAQTGRYLLKTTDGGDNWEQMNVDSADYSNSYSVFFINENTGWLLNENIDEYSVLKTTDGGMDWRKIDVPVTTDLPACEFSLNAVFFVDENTGWIVGAGGIILKSTDGGESWIEQKNENDWIYDLFSVYFVSETKGWAVGSYGIILSTTDGGITWNPQLSHTDNSLYDLTFVSEEAGWICGGSGIILGMLNDIPTTIDRNQLIMPPIQRSLFQNFPNPFSAYTNIQYSLDKPAYVKVSIYNIHGKCVRILENKFQPTGDYSLMWDGTDKNSKRVFPGIYIMNLETTDYCLQKKMLLVR